jgi:hypothetical protein
MYGNWNDPDFARPIRRGWYRKSASCWMGQATVPSECRGQLQWQLLALVVQCEQGAQLRSIGDWSAPGCCGKLTVP